MHTNRADDTPRSDKLITHAKGRRKSDNFNDNVCTATLCELFDTFVQALAISLKVPGLCTQGLGEFQARGNRVNSEDMFWLVVGDVAKCAESYRATANEHDDTVLDLLGRGVLEAVLSCEHACWKYICHKN